MVPTPITVKLTVLLMVAPPGLTRSVLRGHLAVLPALPWTDVLQRDLSQGIHPPVRIRLMSQERCSPFNRCQPAPMSPRLPARRQPSASPPQATQSWSDRDQRVNHSPSTSRQWLRRAPQLGASPTPRRPLRRRACPSRSPSIPLPRDAR